MTARFSFAIHATDGRARTGTITMKRGEIRTPPSCPSAPLPPSRR